MRVGFDCNFPLRSWNTSIFSGGTVEVGTVGQAEAKQALWSFLGPGLVVVGCVLVVAGLFCVRVAMVSGPLLTSLAVACCFFSPSSTDKDSLERVPLMRESP